jgi:integrase/recombinase XerD
LTDIGVNELRRFFIWLQTEYKAVRPNKDASPLSSRSIETAWIDIRAFFTWAIEEKLIAERPDKAIKRPRFAEKVVEPFTTEQVQAIMKACEHVEFKETPARAAHRQRRPTALRDLAIVNLLLDTGLRAGELGRLKIGDMNLNNGSISVTPSGAGMKSRPRIVYFGRRCQQALWRYFNSRGNPVPTESLFPTSDGRPLTPNALRHLLVHIGKAARVPHCHPHRFRHSAAIMYLRNGGDAWTLQKMLGHSDMTMTKRYLHIVDSDLQAAHRIASPVDRLML